MPDFIFDNWPDLAAFAYGSFLDQGKGFVVLGGKELTYQADIENLVLRASSPELKATIRSCAKDYQPQRDAIFITVEGGQIKTVSQMNGTSIWQAYICHQLAAQGHWQITLDRWKGISNPAYEGEEARQRSSFTASQRRKRFKS